AQTVPWCVTYMRLLTLHAHLSGGAACETMFPAQRALPTARAAGSRPALWTLCLPEEGKTDAGPQDLLVGLVSQGVAEHTRHGTALLFLRRQVTGDTPPWSGGQGIAGQHTATTPVAGATNVAPCQPWGIANATLPSGSTSAQPTTASHEQDNTWEDIQADY